MASRSVVSMLRSQLLQQLCFKQAAAVTLSQTGARTLTNIASSAPDAALAATHETFRQSHGFRRWLDGRVQLRSTAGAWHDIKLDANVQGAMLLRDSEGRVSYLSSDSMTQVDLSNDEFIASLFRNRQWEQVRQPLLSRDASTGKDVQMCMTAVQFRAVVSILKEVPPPKAKA